MSQLPILSSYQLTEFLRAGPRHVALTDELTLYVEGLTPEGALEFLGEFEPTRDVREALIAGTPPGLCRFERSWRAFAHPEQLAELMVRWERLRQRALAEARNQAARMPAKAE